MDRVVLRQDADPPHLVAITIESSGDVVQERWRQGARNKASTRYPTAAMPAEGPALFRDGLVRKWVEKGYVPVEDNAEQSPAARRLSALAIVPSDACAHVLKVLEAFGASLEDPTLASQQRIAGTSLVVRRTFNDIRITGIVEGDPADPAHVSELHRHLALLRCVSPAAEVVEGGSPLDVLATLRRARRELDASVAEPLYAFGVLRRPIDLEAALGEAATRYSVGF